MSRGIGRMQNAIIASLDDDRNSYVGMDAAYPSRPGWVTHKGLCVCLHADVFDMRAVMKSLARKSGGISHCNFVRPSFEASFSRAVRGLSLRGVLRFPPLVQILAAETLLGEPAESEAIYHLSCGMYLMVHPSQRRFAMRNNP